MKIRQGHVSNSSSSSFIIGLAAIADEQKFAKWLELPETVKALGGVNSFLSTDDNSRWRLKEFYDKWQIESFNDDTVTLSKEAMDKTLEGLPDNIKAERLLLGESAMRVFGFSHSGGDDSDFWDGDYYNYDINFDFFSEGVQYIAHSLKEKENGLILGDFTYGAGRNG